jgi:hypothetical protein
VALLGTQHGAGIGPGDVEPARLEKARADPGGHELPGGHDARARAIAHLAHHRDAGRELTQLREVALDFLPERHLEIGRESPVALLDRLQLPLVSLADRGVEQPLQAVGDAAHGRVHDQHPGAAGEPLGGDPRDVGPVGECRDARSAKLEDNPGRGATGQARSSAKRSGGCAAASQLKAAYVHLRLSLE